MKRDKMRFLSFCILGSMTFIVSSLGTGILGATVQPVSTSKVNNVKQPSSDPSSSKSAVVKQSNPSSQPPLVVKPLPEISIGGADAPIQVVMYFSPTCHHCAEYEGKVFPKILTDFIETGHAKFTMCLLPFHKLDYTVARLIWSRGLNSVMRLTQLFLSHQAEWLDPVLEDSKKRAELLQKALEETAKLLNIAADILSKKLKIQDNIENAFVLLFALRHGFTFEEIENSSQDDPEFENGLTAAHVQAAESFGKSLDYVPAFVVNGKVSKDWPKPESLRKLLNKIKVE